MELGLLYCEKSVVYCLCVQYSCALCVRCGNREWLVLLFIKINGGNVVVVNVSTVKPLVILPIYSPKKNNGPKSGLGLLV